MGFVEIRADLTRTADALERIVFLLEKLVFPELPRDVKVHKATLGDLKMATPEANERMRQEQIEFAYRNQTVPGSDAMLDALRGWEIEQRSLYGDDWKAPEDWRQIFAGLRGEGAAGGEPAPASSRAAD